MSKKIAIEVPDGMQERLAEIAGECRLSVEKTALYFLSREVVHTRPRGNGPFFGDKVVHTRPRRKAFREEIDGPIKINLAAIKAKSSRKGGAA